MVTEICGRETYDLLSFCTRPKGHKGRHVHSPIPFKYPETVTEAHTRLFGVTAWD